MSWAPNIPTRRILCLPWKRLAGITYGKSMRAYMRDTPSPAGAGSCLPPIAALGKSLTLRCPCFPTPLPTPAVPPFSAPARHLSSRCPCLFCPLHRLSVSTSCENSPSLPAQPREVLPGSPPARGVWLHCSGVAPPG